MLKIGSKVYDTRKPLVKLQKKQSFCICLLVVWLLPAMLLQDGKIILSTDTCLVILLIVQKIMFFLAF